MIKVDHSRFNATNCIIVCMKNSARASCLLSKVRCYCAARGSPMTVSTAETESFVCCVLILIFRYADPGIFHGIFKICGPAMPLTNKKQHETFLALLLYNYVMGVKEKVIYVIK